MNLIFNWGGVTHEAYLTFNPRRLKCVFFSLIQKQKGVALILEAAAVSKNVEFVFYGSIDPSYTEEFYTTIKKLPNVQYRGIFKGSNLEVYRELAKYDVLLFPTKWETEGVPGILVEGKIAGLAEIVSEKSYNAELVKDGIEGIVLRKNTCEMLHESIKRLEDNADLLESLKKGSSLSAERYYVDNYTHMIEADLEE